MASNTQLTHVAGSSDITPMNNVTGIADLSK